MSIKNLPSPAALRRPSALPKPLLSKLERKLTMEETAREGIDEWLGTKFVKRLLPASLAGAAGLTAAGMAKLYTLGGTAKPLIGLGAHFGAGLASAAVGAIAGPAIFKIGEKLGGHIAKKLGKSEEAGKTYGKLATGGAMIAAGLAVGSIAFASYAAGMSLYTLASQLASAGQAEARKQSPEHSLCFQDILEVKNCRETEKIHDLAQVYSEESLEEIGETLGDVKSNWNAWAGMLKYTTAKELSDRAQDGKLEVTPELRKKVQLHAHSNVKLATAALRSAVGQLPPIQQIFTEIALRESLVGAGDLEARTHLVAEKLQERFADSKSGKKLLVAHTAAELTARLRDCATAEDPNTEFIEVEKPA